MKHPLSGLNNVLDHRIRLGVMSVLTLNGAMGFNDLKAMLEVTDGNLATHLLTLEAQDFIHVHKGFTGRKTNTTYHLTLSGERAFHDHLKALEEMIKGIRQAAC